jgi:VWFA-related protein
VRYLIFVTIVFVVGAVGMVGARPAGAQASSEPSRQSPPPPSADDSKVFVTAADQFGAPLPDLKVGSFTLMAQIEHPVTSATYKKDVPDVVLMLEGSAFTKSLRSDIERAAILVISEMGLQERMAVYRFADTAELMQDFTTNKQTLVNAVKGMPYENAVSVADAAYSVLDTAFQYATGRKVLLIVTGGEQGINSAKRQDLVDMAERRQVSIFAVSLAGRGGGGGLLDDLAHETAGVFLYGKELKPLDQAAKNLYNTFRGHYELTVGGSVLAGPLKVDVKGKEKLQVTYRRE